MNLNIVKNKEMNCIKILKEIMAIILYSVLVEMVNQQSQLDLIVLIIFI